MVQGELRISKSDCEDINKAGIPASWNSNSDSCSIDLSDANISFSNFNGASIQLADFRKADIRDSKFKGAKINEAQKSKINWIVPDERSAFEMSMERTIKNAGEEELKELKKSFPELVNKYKPYNF